MLAFAGKPASTAERMIDRVCTTTHPLVHFDDEPVPRSPDHGLHSASAPCVVGGFFLTSANGITTMTAQVQSQTHYDVIVVGSGAGAMTSAVFLADQSMRVLVVEKSDQYGGTSAISGGGIWIPNNHYFARQRGNDSYATALTYLKAAAGEHVDETRLRAYLDNAPKMIEQLTRISRVRYAVAAKYPDYYPHLPGRCPVGGPSTRSCSTPACWVRNWRTCASRRLQPC